MQVDIFTDGACRGNPGPGGWAAILRCKGVEKELTGGAPETTNNRMELSAVIEGLKALKKSPCNVTIHTDSKYVMDGATKWMDGWKKKNWRTAKGPVKNLELWQELSNILEQHNVSWKWVKGHAGHPENERADALATAEADTYNR